MAPISPDRWQLLEPLLDSALELTPEERPSFLATACASDPGLRADLETLLEAHDRPDTLLEQPAAHRFSSLLGAIATPPPAVVNDLYRIERRLGQGGTATVWLAHDLRHDRKVALKVVHPDLAVAFRAERFFAEIRTMANLHHPHILPLHDSGEVDGLLYYVMPYVEGETLRQRLGREPRPSPGEAVSIAEQVADALDSAHRHGIIHRDIKPENILLGEGGALVADFGIALALRSAAMTGAAAGAAGTPGYMSPEQRAGATVDQRSDVYALGVVCYEMLAGRLPSEPGDRLPGASDPVLARAVAERADDRYASAGELAGALRRSIEPRTRSGARLGLAAAALLLAGLGILGTRHGQKASPIATGPRSAVAVLPFRNLSSDSSHAYFAEGLHDELLTQLGKVASLKVVGRSTVGEYEATSKPLRQIAQELAVGSVVEGSVQVVGRRLRISMQLLDPATGTDLWAEQYDRTLDDAFAVQSEIAQRVVSAIGGTLTSAEAGALATAPTRNAEAYDLYLQGIAYWRRPGLLRENILIAQQQFERAVALDSGFALAHAQLSKVDYELHGRGLDPSGARLDQAQREARTALRIDPELPQAHLAAGFGYLETGESREALAEFNRALRGAPRDAELWGWVGRMQRNLGNYDAALAAFDQSRKLDPLEVNLLQCIGDAYHYLRRYREAIEDYRHELLLAPDLVQPRLSLAWSYFLWKGQLDTLRAVLQSLPIDAETGSEGGPAVGNWIAC